MRHHPTTGLYSYGCINIFCWHKPMFVVDKIIEPSTPSASASHISRLRTPLETDWSKSFLLRRCFLSCRGNDCLALHLEPTSPLSSLLSNKTHLPGEIPSSSTDWKALVSYLSLKKNQNNAKYIHVLSCTLSSLTPGFSGVSCSLFQWCAVHSKLSAEHTPSKGHIQELGVNVSLPTLSHLEANLWRLVVHLWNPPLSDLFFRFFNDMTLLVSQIHIQCLPADLPLLTDSAQSWPPSLGCQEGRDLTFQ